jgi:hypothetical protein
MTWTVFFDDAFIIEFTKLDVSVQLALRDSILVLQEFGPSLGRPHVDTLKGSKHANMKELRFKAADGVWRIAFAFDPKRNAIILCAGNKAGTSQNQFYKNIIRIADKRFDRHLKNQLKGN